MFNILLITMYMVWGQNLAARISQDKISHGHFKDQTLDEIYHLH